MSLVASMYRPFSGDWHNLSAADAAGMLAFFPHVSSGTSEPLGLDSGDFVATFFFCLFCRKLQKY
jgi:hypothetical protein